ncbi:inorganic pyrophosphatase [Candidatus Cerribacteria bacterium 'Amazon FNV 2010 28 9']|uniref:Inorganic pyrophosphatase n=1 Tax=Candidatus Cerribacteria bacterium 'Amazon FNV 2010 28 9' TaxID=2081795 RepID=A0A317JQE6_9BACT|nr:MAG: inorganic pyrophosphatase [Candidatus Cerribacteria bacterium 'Amazon FNV 2010 28 9']
MSKTQTLQILVEIPEGTNVKYEYDDKTGRIYVDRIVPTPMKYPTNYCSIEGAMGKDGDLMDALLLTAEPIMPGMWVKGRAIGMLEMEDEEGVDNKIICVLEKAKQDAVCGSWENITDVPEHWLNKIKHFFEHYKDLEKGKWVKINRFLDKDAAEKELEEAMQKMKEECDCDCKGGDDCKCEDGCSCCGECGCK